MPCLRCFTDFQRPWKAVRSQFLRHPSNPSAMLPTRVLRMARGPKANITGFSMRAFQESTGQPRYDPWERAEAWRYTGTFSRWNRFKTAFPGLGTASVAFAGYCVYEHFFMNEGHHEEGHHAEGHH